ncbi:hypothetical protein ACA910_006727 [Epithemia clementina (nom. ined.)]
MLFLLNPQNNDFVSAAPSVQSIRQTLASSRGFFGQRHSQSNSQGEGRARPSSSSEHAVTTILNHLAETSPISDFYIQGWRWHTLSLIRESNRLAKAATTLQRRGTSAITTKDSFLKAADYVVNFNMRGLHRIEGELFLPWIVKRPTIKEQPREITHALKMVIEDLDHIRENVRKHGVLLMEAVNMENLASGSSATSLNNDWLDVVAQQSTLISLQSKHILDTADALLVPLIQRHVSKSEQKAFNNRVIRLLGIWDSRLHLVGMHQATLSLPKERALFQQIIPKFPQSMIPRWKRLLYDPKVEALKAFG